jgi:DNA polymerase III delta prime subunit
MTAAVTSRPIGSVVSPSLEQAIDPGRRNAKLLGDLRPRPRARITRLDDPIPQVHRVRSHALSDRQSLCRNLNCSKAVQAWLTTLDQVPAHTLVIFTTTEDSADLFGQFDGPFRSRCKSIPFTNQGLAQAFARRAREIADREGLNGKPESAYVRLVQRCHNNLRAALQEIEAGAMMDEEGP